jgi:multicomponent Na+:H+ antiporter subunit F
MTPADAVAFATTAALVLLGLALFLTVYRIVVGPTLADRVLALDLLTVLAMGFVGAIAIRTGITLYIDIAIALALLGFLATVAFARYILSRNPEGEKR